MSYHGNNEIHKISTKSIILLAKIQSGIKLLNPILLLLKLLHYLLSVILYIIINAEPQPHIFDLNYLENFLNKLRY